jgi:hypothetical protein
MNRSLLRVCAAVVATIITTCSRPIPTAHADAASVDTPRAAGMVVQPAPGHHLETRRSTGLAGAITFGVSYGLAAASAAGLMFFSDLLPPAGHGVPFGDVARLFVPVAGPFLQMPKAEGNATANVLLAVDGLGQLAGATLIVVDLAFPRTIPVRDDMGHVQIVPMKVSGGGGLGLVGTF